MTRQKRTPEQKRLRAAERAGANAAIKGIASAPKKAAKQPVKASKPKRPPVAAKMPKPETPVPTAELTEAVDLSKLPADKRWALEIHDRIVECKGKLPTNVTRDKILDKSDDSVGGMLDSLKEAWAEVECPGLEVRLYR